MKVWTNKILFILISISFAIAVFEIDSDSRHNTFHDEDDTYVQSNNQNVEISSHFEQQKDLSQLHHDFTISICNLFLINKQAASDFSSQKFFSFIPQKIFLQNSVWRI
jgi:hypothetical protein